MRAISVHIVMTVSNASDRVRSSESWAYCDQSLKLRDGSGDNLHMMIQNASAFMALSRSEAATSGLSRFYTGTPCREGHRAERYVSNRQCVACNAAKARQRERTRGFREPSFRMYRNTLRRTGMALRGRASPASSVGCEHPELRDHIAARFSDAKKVEFAVDAYLERCKQLNGYDVRWDKILEGEAKTFSALNGDFRDYINVHDLGAILAAIVHAIKSRSVSIETNFVERHFAYVILSLRNFGFPFFSQLSSRLS
jgi:hypothetical protein